MIGLVVNVGSHCKSCFDIKEKKKPTPTHYRTIKYLYMYLTTQFLLFVLVGTFLKRPYPGFLANLNKGFVYYGIIISIILKVIFDIGSMIFSFKL